MVLQVVKVVVVVVDVIADPENFIPNPKAISSSDPVKVVGVPNENTLAAVELEAFDTEMNPMMLKLVVATTVDAGTNLSGAAAAARCQNRKSKQVSFRDGVATTEAVQGRLAPERVDFYSEEVR